MGIETLAMFTAALQFSQALGAFLGRIQPPPANVWAVAAVAIGRQVATNATTVLAAAVAAGIAEFSLANGNDKSIAGKLASLPVVV